MRKRWFMVGTILLLLVTWPMVGCGVAQEKHEAVVSELNSTKQELQFAKYELNNAQADIETTRDELKGAEEELAKTRERLKEKEEELETSKAELEAEHNKLQAKLAESEAELTELRDNYEIIQSDIGQVIWYVALDRVDWGWQIEELTEAEAFYDMEEIIYGIGNDRILMAWDSYQRCDPDEEDYYSYMFWRTYYNEMDLFMDELVEKF